ncbi:serine/threonine protein kinase [Streptomyces sp. P38-E01]|uniref:non-specific serine/threonine protein kinase n=1 Tax=Streptomyces tardus TaxID=2780544 RepID=A0A949N7U5_9ACTN|nr:serine/threonine-protein kinase [Streptomyces tardus]MBU7597816.1 serine/threonine protein kinase [Streptomyces tardus]
MGEVFAGRYELVDPIGRGGAGAVWRSWDHRRKRYVAAKVLQQSDAHTLLRFVREQALRIDHPHVLAPTSWAADDDQVLFTMDLVSGGSLAHLLGDYGKLPPATVLTLLDQLLAGLSAVHAEDVVHRDIKPANILLEATGTGRPHLRVSDFGISMRKGEPRLTETNFIVGTPGYFAPEQLLGADPDFTADLYAVGLVALYLLTGVKPDSRALVETYRREGGVPAAPEYVPEPLWHVLGTLLQPDPAARFKTALGVRKALADCGELIKNPADGGSSPTVEVFDQIGPLPAGYGPDGPQPSGARALQDEPTRTAAGPPPGAPPTGAGSTGTARPGAASETGSFRLAPPSSPPPASPHSPPPDPAAVSPGAPYPYPTEGTYGYPPHGGGAAPHPSTGQPPGSHPQSARSAAPRPGPSAKVAVPVLMLAFVLIAVGVWALTQS